MDANGVLSAQEEHEAGVVWLYLWDHSQPLPVGIFLCSASDKCMRERRELNLPPLDPGAHHIRVQQVVDLLVAGQSELPAELAQAVFPSEICAAAAQAWWQTADEGKRKHINGLAEAMMESKRAQAHQ
jgi:hypothetical protein